MPSNEPLTSEHRYDRTQQVVTFRAEREPLDYHASDDEIDDDVWSRHCDAIERALAEVRAFAARYGPTLASRLMYILAADLGAYDPCAFDERLGYDAERGLFRLDVSFHDETDQERADAAAEANSGQSTAQDGLAK
jgi:hypothetical protein